MTSKSFKTQVSFDDALSFANLSGDWNPLHTNPEHASNTAFRRPVLHGAFSAGLLSRMAGMYLPGTDCLLHNMRIRFVAPIIPPATLEVVGNLVGESSNLGRVDVTITDADTGVRYVDGVYEFSRHEILESKAVSQANEKSYKHDKEAPILVVGASGGLGRVVLSSLDARAIGISRSAQEGMIHVPDFSRIGDVIGDAPIKGIVYCAWPALDNTRLIDIKNLETSVEHSITDPLRQMISLGQLLAKQGEDNAMLVLIGSTASMPGRHNYRMPLYTLSKSLVPELTRILATELGPTNKRCVAVTYDVIDGGMNKRLSPGARVAHADRSPTGMLPSMEEAASQIAWLFQNPSFLVSGANISLTGSAVP